MIRSAFSIASICALAGAVSASTITLTHRNSEAIFEDDAPGVQQIAWNVDSISHLATQDFYIGVAGSGPISLASINEDLIQSNDTRLIVTYTVDGVEVVTDYTLRGNRPGSEISQLKVNISLTNTTDSALDVDFFQFSDFELGGTQQDFRVGVVLPTDPDSGNVIVNMAPNVVEQEDTQFAANETIVAPRPTSYEFGIEADVLAAVQAGVLTNPSGSVFLGDLAWAFGWGFNDSTDLGALAAGQTRVIQKDLRIARADDPFIPAPGVAGLLALAGVAAARRRR